MSDLTANRTELRELLQARSIQRGEFTLTSGAGSSYYCDTKATTLSPSGARVLGETLFEILSDHGAEAVGGLALGSTFIATAIALASELQGRPMYGFAVRDEKKAHGLERH